MYCTLFILNTVHHTSIHSHWILEHYQMAFGHLQSCIPSVPCACVFNAWPFNFSMTFCASQSKSSNLMMIWGSCKALKMHPSKQYASGVLCWLDVKERFLQSVAKFCRTEPSLALVFMLLHLGHFIPNDSIKMILDWLDGRQHAEKKSNLTDIIFKWYFLVILEQGRIQASATKRSTTQIPLWITSSLVMNSCKSYICHAELWCSTEGIT